MQTVPDSASKTWIIWPNSRCPVVVTPEETACPRQATVKVEIVCPDGHCVLGTICAFHAEMQPLDGWACGICAADDRLSESLLYVVDR